MGGTDAKRVFWCMTAVAAFISCFLIGFSVDAYHPMEMAFILNANRGVPETDKLFNNGGGRLLTGLGRRFEFTFPREARRLVFANTAGAASPLISGRLRDGLQVDIGLSVQYKLKQDRAEVENLFYSYGSNWEDFFSKYIRGASRNVLSEHGVFDMWERRGVIQTGLEREIRAVLDRRHAELVAVQLLSLDIPPQVQTAIEATTVMVQNQFEALERKAATNVSAYTRFFEAQRDAGIQVINARKNGFVLLREAEAAATSRQLEIDAQADSLMLLQRGLNITDKDHLLAMLYMDTLSQTTSRVTFGVPQAEATVQGGT